MSSRPEAALALRRVGAAALTGGAGLGFFALTHGYDGDVSMATLFTALLGAAAFGFTRRSLGAQIASRAMTWLLFAPTAMITIADALRGTVEWKNLALALATGGALLLAHPALHTADARRVFDPVRFRRFFLAGATAMTSAAMIAFAFAADGIRTWSYSFEPLAVAVSGAVGIALLTSVVALLRMRGWGLLLGGATSLAALAIAPFARTADGVALALAAVPALLFWVLPVLTARTTLGTAPVRLRVHADASARPRVATEPELVDEEALELETIASAQPRREVRSRVGA